MLDEALSIGERTGLRHDEAELRRLKGEALLLQEPSAIAEAEICYRRAIEIAHGQLAKWWQLRATVSLARLLRNTGRREEARNLLVGIYYWFKEGFELPDLKANAGLGKTSGKRLMLLSQ